jgi:hypothetical protein
MSNAFDEYKQKTLNLLQMMADENYENLDGESYVINKKLRLKLMSIMDKVKTL